MDVDAPRHQVHQSHLGDAVAGVERHLDVAVVGQTGIGDFHEEQHKPVPKLYSSKAWMKSRMRG